MDTIKRILVIVMDGVGIGELPDAQDYGDTGSHTLGNLAREQKGLSLPNLERWGLGNITEIEGLFPSDEPACSYGKMREISPGKDSTSGHWELMGCPLEKPFPVYPDGFPPEVIHQFTELAGIAPLGNVAASGTEIIEELGEEHLKTGKPIVYTSADSVFQVAAHVKVWPVDKLHSVCAAMRDALVEPHQVARVIARPFFGEPGQFVRSPERKDFTVVPFKDTILDRLVAENKQVIGIGKISDLFGGRGITISKPSKGLDICLEDILDTMDEQDEGFIFCNLGEFDTLWGHRNDPDGFARGLEQLDAWIEDFEKALRPGRDIAFLTADHGCDPTTPSTDHSREYVPLLVWTGERPGVDLGERESFSDVAATCASIFGLTMETSGTSFKDDLPFVEVEEVSRPESEGFDESHAPKETGEKDTVSLPDDDKPLFYGVLREEVGIADDDRETIWAQQKETGRFCGLKLVENGQVSHGELVELLGLALVRWLDLTGLYNEEIKQHFDKRDHAAFWGDQLVEEGLISEEELVGFFVRACGIPYIQLVAHEVPPEIATLLNREAAVTGGVLPIEKDEEMLTVATSKPADTRLVEEISEMTNCSVRTVVAKRDQLLEALGRVYVERDEIEEEIEPDKADAPDSSVEGEETPGETAEADREEGVHGESDGVDLREVPEKSRPIPEESPVVGSDPRQEELEWLVHTAKAVSRHAYAPHSRLKIGAAVLADNGEVYAGCNIENDSYGLSICAERVAIFKAISSGRKGIRAIAVVCDQIKNIRPCGACLQVIHQFGPKAILVFQGSDGNLEKFTIKDLLPFAFSWPEELE